MLFGGKKIFIAILIIAVVVFLGLRYGDVLFPNPTSEIVTETIETQSLRLDDVENFFVKNEYDIVIEKGQEFIDDYPDSNLIPEVLFFIGRSYEEKNQNQESIFIFQKIIDEYPDYINTSFVYYELGIINLNLGNESKANDYFNQVLNQYPNTEAWHLVNSEYYKIQPLFQSKKYEEAINKSNEVLTKDPGSKVVASILFIIGRCYDELGDNDKAITIFQKIIDEYSDNPYAPRAIYEIGLIYYKVGEYEKVEGYANKLLNEYPDASLVIIDYARQFLESKNK